MTNRITIQSRLAFDPELRFTQSGKAVCEVRFADQKRRKNDAGTWEDASDPTWFRAAVWGDEAEALAEHGKKGDRVVVTGQLITRNFEKDGQQRQSLEVDFATVAVVPSAPKAARQQQSSGDPWSTSGQQSDIQPPF